MKVEELEVFWSHLANREIWELEWICMQGKCSLCNKYYPYVWG